MPDRKELHHIQSLARGLEVLDAFSAAEPRLSLSELAAKVGLTPSAAQRYTDTLMQLGYLKRNQHRQFHLGPKVLSLGFAFLDGNALRQMAGELIDEFGARLKRTVNLAVLEDTHVFFLHRHEAQRFIGFGLRAGSRLPAQITATGKVLLAGLPDAGLKKLLARITLEKVTRHTITSKKRLMDDLMKTRARGYSLVDRELSPALVQIGSPVLGKEGQMVAAINLSLPAEEAGDKSLEQARQQLFGLGRELSAGLGWQGDYPLISPPAAKGAAR